MKRYDKRVKQLFQPEIVEGSEAQKETLSDHINKFNSYGKTLRPCPEENTNNSVVHYLSYFCVKVYTNFTYYTECSKRNGPLHISKCKRYKGKLPPQKFLG